jgi:SAM-dependent methyltransferase
MKKQILIIIKAVTLSGMYEVLCYKVCKNRCKKLTLPPDLVRNNILHKVGLEIGGPSRVFSGKGIISLYDIAETVDNVNYSRVTMWDNPDLSRFATFRKTIISEASDLGNIESNSYDFVASSNVIEHLSNPLRALLEMKRVVRPGGLVIAIAPHKDITFDHKRSLTNIDSLIRVFKLSPPEGDISHFNLNEIFENYDLDLDPPAGDLDSFKKRTLDNKSNRALHQTVFNTQLLLEMFNWAEIKILFVKTSLMLGHILVIGENSEDSKYEIQQYNLNFLGPDADWRNNTIFRSERTRKYEMNRGEPK